MTDIDERKAQAKELAEAHKAQDATTQVFYFPNADPDAVCLLEVSGRIGTIGEALPLRFGAAPAAGCPFPTVVILISTEELRRIKARDPDLILPPGWDFDGTEDPL
jgi:ABC-type Fe3+-hydroxamate transport system substrate-binding protein